MAHSCISPKLLLVSVLAFVCGACQETTCCIDDYRESAAVIRGSVHEVGGAAVAGAVLEFTANTPPYLAGDTATADGAGSFHARVTSFGVGTFTASIRLRVRRSVSEPIALDTLLNGVRVVEDRGGATPDTLSLTLELPQL